MASYKNVYRWKRREEALRGDRQLENEMRRVQSVGVCKADGKTEQRVLWCLLRAVCCCAGCCLGRIDWPAWNRFESMRDADHASRSRRNHHQKSIVNTCKQHHAGWVRWECKQVTTEWHLTYMLYLWLWLNDNDTLLKCLEFGEKLFIYLSLSQTSRNISNNMVYTLF